MPKNALIIIILIVVIIYALSSAIIYLIKPLGIIALICGGLFLSYRIYINWYFNSNKFKNIKDRYPPDQPHI